MSDWHLRKIPKGTYGELSKIAEELEEAYDSEERGQTLMLMFELSDIIGAAGGVAARYGMSLDDLVTFSKLRSQIAVGNNINERPTLKNLPIEILKESWLIKYKMEFIFWIKSLAFWKKR